MTTAARVLLPALGFALLAAAAAARTHVLELGDADFDYLATEHETMLVKFYAPWCGHCKKLAPEFEKAASRLKGSVQLAKVDCTANAETCRRFGVSGYPTLKIFRSGRDSAPYDGPRSAEGMYQVMQLHAGPDSLLLQSDEELQDFTHHQEASIIGVFSGSDGSRLPEFLAAAALLRDQFRFGHSSNTRLCERHQAKAECVLLVRPPHLSSSFEDSVVVFRDHLTISSLRRFIRDHLYGLCPHLTAANRERLRVRDLLTVYYDLDFQHNLKGSNYWRNRVMKVVSQFSGRGLTFSVANRKDFLWELQEDFGLGASAGGELPVVTIRTRMGHKFTMREEFTRDGSSLQRFLLDYFSGRLKRFIKSEPVPAAAAAAAANPAAVKVVVAENFEQVVLDPDRDVLVQFYSPSCPHCTRLEPVFKELAATLQDDSSLVVAKMNAVDNDVPLGFDVPGFPTIYLVLAGRKDDPIRYQGGRELQDFLKFLKRERSRDGTVGGSKDEL